MKTSKFRIKLNDSTANLEVDLDKLLTYRGKNRQRRIDPRNPVEQTTAQTRIYEIRFSCESPWGFKQRWWLEDKIKYVYKLTRDKKRVNFYSRKKVNFITGLRYRQFPDHTHLPWDGDIIIVRNYKEEKKWYYSDLLLSVLLNRVRLATSKAISRLCAWIWSLRKKKKSRLLLKIGEVPWAQTGSPVPLPPSPLSLSDEPGCTKTAHTHNVPYTAHYTIFIHDRK